MNTMRAAKFFLLCVLLLLCFWGTAQADTALIQGVPCDADAVYLDLSGLQVVSLYSLEYQLKRMPNLQEVDLSFCDLSDEQLDWLRARMAEQGVTVVWTLRLGRMREVDQMRPVSSSAAKRILSMSSLGSTSEQIP